jgi:hypothetical protein
MATPFALTAPVVMGLGDPVLDVVVQVSYGAPRTARAAAGGGGAARRCAAQGCGSGAC